MGSRRIQAWLAGALVIAFLGGPSISSARSRSSATPIIFLSTQFTPVLEAETYRSQILNRAPIPVTFVPAETGAFVDRVKAEEKSGNVSVSVLGGLHGDLTSLAATHELKDVTPVLKRLHKRGFPESVLKLAMMGSKNKHFYVPWMQATYILEVNRRALKYLPKGANVTALTYDQLIRWGQNMKRGTGQRLIGLPAGPTGLLHRLIQGYFYPSFTGSAGVRGFRGPEAVKMWKEVRDLWAVTNPRSLSYSFMQDPLLSGEVWVAWDHVARLVDAATTRPKSFMLVPAPAGPRGRGYISVVAGLGIPRGAPGQRAGEQLLDFLTQPRQQIKTLEELGFFPITNARIPADLPAGIRMEAAAVKRQSDARDAVLAVLPIGLGDKNAAFNKVFVDTFTRIVIGGERIPTVLDSEARVLRGVMAAAQAPCWPPDAPSKGPCPVGKR